MWKALYTLQNVFDEVQLPEYFPADADLDTLGSAEVPGPGSVSAKAEIRAFMWVAVKIMVPFRVLTILRHLVCGGPKRRP